MNFVKLAIFIGISLLAASCAAEQPSNSKEPLRALNELRSQMEAISANSYCSTDNECGSVTLGWSQCSIDNIEFGVNHNNKNDLSRMLDDAGKYESAWKGMVESGEIEGKCLPQRFSKTACIKNRCALVGPQVQPEKAPETDPYLKEKLLGQ